jgi:hypothetical protein
MWIDMEPGRQPPQKIFSFRPGISLTAAAGRVMKELARCLWPKGVGSVLWRPTAGHFLFLQRRRNSHNRHKANPGHFSAPAGGRAGAGLFDLSAAVT